MQNQIDPKYKKPQRKREVIYDYSSKSTGNSLQFKFNSGLQDDIEDILEDHNLDESTVEDLKPNVSIISKRNKVIKSTNRSSAGWASIAEYKDNPYNPFASDSEDSEKFGKLKIELWQKIQKRLIDHIYMSQLQYRMTVSRTDLNRHYHNFFFSSHH